MKLLYTILLYLLAPIVLIGILAMLITHFLEDKIS